MQSRHRAPVVDRESTRPHTAVELIPSRPSLATLRDAAARCTACPLHARATQTVFGEGPAHAPLMLVGEQPGDREDIEGHPFVGPAGRVLDQTGALGGGRVVVVDEYEGTVAAEEAAHDAVKAMGDADIALLAELPTERSGPTHR